MEWEEMERRNEEEEFIESASMSVFANTSKSFYKLSFCDKTTNL